MDDVLKHATMPLSRFCLLQHAFIRMILDVAGAFDQIAVQSRQAIQAEGSTASDAADGADVEGVTAAIKCACMQSVDPLSSLHVMIRAVDMLANEQKSNQLSACR
jgi:hypothetical protein